MEISESKNPDKAIDILQKLYGLITKYGNWDQKLMWLTLNNMSWVQMKIGNSKAAFESSLMAFAQMKAYPSALKHYALSWANLSAILSMLQLLIYSRINI